MPDTSDAVEALALAYGDVTNCLNDLTETEAWLPSGCVGWAVRDLAFHLLLDAQRALVAVGTPGERPADTDAVSYWRDWRPGTDRAQVNLRMMRIMASVYPTFDRLRGDYEETARAVVHLFGRSDPEQVVATQGHALRVADLAQTLVVEAGVHHLDLVVVLDRPGPSTGTLRVVRQTLDGLLGQPVPVDWDDATYARRGTGRTVLTRQERATLGPLADRLPLFG